MPGPHVILFILGASLVLSVALPIALVSYGHVITPSTTTTTTTTATAPPTTTTTVPTTTTAVPTTTTTVPTTTTTVPTTTTTVPTTTTTVPTTTTTTTTSVPTTAPPPNCTGILGNPDFESGVLSPWSIYAGSVQVNSTAWDPDTASYSIGAHGGTYFAELGNPGPTPQTYLNSEMYQAFTMPSDCSVNITFWYRVTGTYAYFFAYASLFDSGWSLVTEMVPALTTNGTIPWTFYTCNICSTDCGGVDLTPYAGQLMYLDFSVLFTTYNAAMFVDDVCIASV